MSDVGSLYLVATPIGNLEDITLRAVRVLKESQLIAAEDTRRAKILLTRYDIHVPTLSLFEGNERTQTERVMKHLRAGERVSVISDGGYPCISDPGFPLLQACIAESIAIEVIPGPSAVPTALVLSGLPCATFQFLGFLPRKGTARRRPIDRLRQAVDTVIVFEAPHRTAASLADLARELGPRPAAVVREMTKLHQEVKRGNLAELASYFAEHPPRGEVTIVIGGVTEEESASTVDLPALVEQAVSAGKTPRQIADELAHHGRRRVYQLALGTIAKG